MSLQTHQESTSLWRRLAGPTEEALQRRWREARERHEPLELCFGARYWVPVIVLALVFLTLFVPPAEENFDKVVPGLLLTSPFLWFAGRRLLTRRPAVRIDQEGVYITKLKMVVPWEFIHNVREETTGRSYGWVVLEVDKTWASANTDHLPLYRAIGPRLRRGDLAWFPFPSGLEVSPGVLDSWLTERVYAAQDAIPLPDPTHLRVTFSEGEDSIDPDDEWLLNLVEWLSDGDYEWMRIAHVGLDPAGATSLLLERRRDGTIAFQEYNSAGATKMTYEKDVEVAGAMVLAWVQAVDAEAAQGGG